MRLLTTLALASNYTKLPALGATNPAEPAPLAQLALQKVIRDATEIFGSPPEIENSTRSRWMSAYPDDTPLTALSIPGVHDAATWNYTQARQDALQPITDLVNITLRAPETYRCQRSSIASALGAGVRFFDFRYALDPTESRLVFWHQDALMSELSAVDDVLFALWDWLDAHPSEVVFLSFQYEGATYSGASNSAVVQRMFYETITSPSSRRFFVQSRNSLGSLGEARGKAILMTRSGMGQLPPGYEDDVRGLYLSPELWTDNSPDIELLYNTTTNSTAYIEDYYEPSMPLSANASQNIEAKVKAVVAHLNKAAGKDLADSLFITFTSGQHLGADEPVYPEIMALGNGTEVTPDGGVNQRLLPVLRDLKGQRRGIVVLDFWDEPAGLVDAILDL